MAVIKIMILKDSGKRKMVTVWAKDLAKIKSVTLTPFYFLKIWCPLFNLCSTLLHGHGKIMRA